MNAVTGLGRALGISVTAEGVETRQQLDRVRSDECDEAQALQESGDFVCGDGPAEEVALFSRSDLSAVARQSHTAVVGVISLHNFGSFRIVDGREAVTFRVRVKEAIEDPQRLVLDLQKSDAMALRRLVETELSLTLIPQGRARA